MAAMLLSHALGGGLWEFISLVMFGLWVMCRMPWERAARMTTLHSKQAAVEWAQSLPDDV